MDDTGVAGDHDDAGEDEGDDDLVPGEVDTAERGRSSSGGKSRVSPDDIISIIAVGDGDDICAVGVVVGEHILSTPTVRSWCNLKPGPYLGPDHRDGQEYREHPDGGHHLPTVAKGAEGPGVVGVDDHYEPLQRDGGQVEDCRCGGENSEIFGNLAEDSGLVHLDREVVEELGGDGHHDQQQVGDLEGVNNSLISLQHLNPTERDKRNKLVFQVSECNFLLVFCLIMMRITEMLPMMPPTMQRM